MTRSVLAILFNWLSGRFRQPVASSVLEASQHLVALQPDIATSDVVPYDENLLERARTQWQFGDWESLAKLERDTLQHHPERAKLALLVAAGHLQTNNGAAARQFVRLAQEWGCSKKLISQILISGVHNSLGRAAAIAGYQNSALQHFRSAIAVGTPASEERLMTQARLGEQMRQLGMAGQSAAPGFAHHAEQHIPMPVGLNDGTRIINDKLLRQQETLERQLKKQAEEFAQTRKSLENTLKREMHAAAKRIEAFIGVQNYFHSGELPSLSTEKNDWPVGPDFALYLIELLEAGRYDAVVEFGSGVSTVVIAKALNRIASFDQDKPPAKFISFEHLEQYFARTRAGLEQAGVLAAVQLILAPLAPYVANNGNAYPYYACIETFAGLATALSPKGRKILLVVDGPPGNTAKHARYPAVPIALRYLRGAHIDVLLDDYGRPEEKEIVELWKSDVSAAGLRFQSATRDLERGACLVRIRPGDVAEN